MIRLFLLWALIFPVLLAAGRLSVLGHYPDYIRVAEELHAECFNVSVESWEGMSECERWRATREFLDGVVESGSSIVLATPGDAPRSGSWFERELSYLLSKGYRLSEDGFSLYFCSESEGAFIDCKRSGPTDAPDSRGPSI